ncbi:MAG TPA: ABC transporter permease [Candidatus Angelobacter sp.]|nr:ABC transporter permease [Candidatus Angelobacter sp.]
MNDLKFAFRQLLKNPGFTVVAVVTLALGIGANTAIFQLLNAVRLKTLPVSKPQELMEVRIVGGNPGLGISDSANAELTYPLWEQLQKRQGTFAGIFAWGSGELPVGSGVETRMTRCLWASGDFFSALGVAPVRGRLLSPEDDRRGAGPGGVVISYGFWQSEFGGEESAIGKSLTLGDRTFQVVGVTPPAFFGLEVGNQFDVALPLTTRELWWDNVLDRTDAWWLRVMGRLKSGSNLAQAAEYVKTISPGIIEATLPVGYGAGTVESYRKFQLSAFPAGTGVSQLRADYEKSLWLLFGITGLVLLIACVNLANLTLARASARAREIAVRLAVGASRARLVRQLLSESLLLAGFGAVAGAWLAHFLSRSVVWFLSTQGNRLSIDLHADWRVLAFTSAVAILTCVFFGLTPAIRSARTAPAVALSAIGRGTTGNREHLALQRGLTILQMAVSLVLLSGALLLVRSFWNLTTMRPGFRQDGVFVTRVNFARVNLPAGRRAAFKTELLDGVRSIPRVEAAALTTHVPVISGSWTMGVRVTGARGEKEGWSKVAWVSPDYFRTLEIPILTGRDISKTDTTTSPKVALVNETFVRQWLEGANPIGARVRTGAEPGYPEATYEIVGVVKDTKYGNLRNEIPPITFAPASQIPDQGTWATIVVRSSAPLPGIIAAVRRRLGEAYPAIRMETSVLKTQIREGLARERLLAWLSGFFGVLAAVLVMVGLYGLVSYTTLLRRNELGVRLALGAQRSKILWLVLRQGLKLAAIGIGVGLVGALALTHFLSSLLFDLKATDPATLILTSLLLVAVASFACWLPAQRAAKIGPMEALRYE